MRLKCLISILVLLAFTLLLPSSTAQEKSKQEKTKKDEKQLTPLYVKLDVVVTDSNYQLVNDVTKDRFRIFEDDVPQTLSLFEPKAKPLGFVLAIDASLSLRTQFPIVLATANLIVNSATPDEKVMLRRFISTDKIRKEEDFTFDHTELLKAIDGYVF